MPSTDDAGLDAEAERVLAKFGLARASTSGKPTRAARRKAAARERKATGGGGAAEPEAPTEEVPPSLPQGVSIEYVTVDPSTQAGAGEEDPALAELLENLTRFGKAAGAGAGATDAERAEAGASGTDEEGGGAAAAPASASAAASARGGLSNKARRGLLQDAIAELKRSVAHPEVVESVDVTSPDPRLLVFLKSSRNAVPIPRHWSAKRKYLQGKRGIERPPFALPDYIAATGIGKLRGAEADAAAAGEEKSLKAKTRERFVPKMGRIEIDYEVLRDAFFKYQTKPKSMSKFGQLYYEGKEFEQGATYRPGVLSDRLRDALGMTGPTSPPPWLVSMQRFGPPPAFPNLRIPGLSAPLPPGAVYGTHPGGWGRPPVDAAGQPLYGDVFGLAARGEGEGAQEHRPLWGEFRPSELSAPAVVVDGLAEPIAPPPAPPPPPPAVPGDASVSPSLASGTATPALMELRKDVQPSEPPALYRVLAEKKTALTGSLLGTSHAYDLTGVAGGGVAAAAAAAAAGGVAVALAPEEMAAGLDANALKRKYDEAAGAGKAGGGSGVTGDDMAELLAAQAAAGIKRAKKEKGSSSAAYKF